VNSVRAYLVALVAICMILATCGFLLILGQAHAGSRTQAAAHAQETARALSQAVDGELERAEGVLAALKASDALRARDWPALDRQARAAFADPNTWVVVQDRSGQQLVNTKLPPGASLPRIAPPQEMWQTLDAGHRHVCNLVRGAVSPNIVCLDLGADAGPRPPFALTVVFRPETFERIITRKNIAEGELASLLDRNGTVIWRNIHPARFIGKQASGPLRKLIGEQAIAGTLESRSLENVPMLTAYQRSSLSGWSVIVGLPLSELDAGNRGALLRASLLALAVMLFGGGLALVLGRRLTMGLKRLAHVLDASPGSGDVPSTGLAEFDAAALALQRASDARARSERHQQMLIGELNHRVKNTLAIVQSLAQQTFRGTPALREPVKAFESRLQALGAAHNLLTREGWISAPLREIVSNALAPFCSGDRCRIDGPPVDVPPQMGVSLALALHELATNAVKYGALSTPHGVVTVGWTLSDGAFTLVWQEQGGPRVEAPEREGFGTRLIKRTLASQLSGEVKIDFAPEGVRCVLVGRLPLLVRPDVVAPAGAGADLAAAT
jgi:two-component sensor histidine kinase